MKVDPRPLPPVARITPKAWRWRAESIGCGRRNAVSQDRTRYFDEGGAARKAVTMFSFLCLYESRCVMLNITPDSAMLVLFGGLVFPITLNPLTILFRRMKICFVRSCFNPRVAFRPPAEMQLKDKCSPRGHPRPMTQSFCKANS